MNELEVIVEGRTEKAFVQGQLQEHLARHNVRAWASLPRKSGNQGGVPKWAAAKSVIINTLKERRFCSTMFDYYGMPSDWPGRQEASTKPWNERASFVEKRIHDVIVQEMGDKFDARFFIPYVQLHEFEALMFADVRALALSLSSLSGRAEEALIEEFTRIVSEVGHPEAINDRYETCPSRRIKAIVPGYKKVAFGSIITSKIGIEVLRSRCSHFGEWLTRLEQLGAKV